MLLIEDQLKLKDSQVCWVFKILNMYVKAVVMVDTAATWK